ncbi:TIR-like protein FxsC [Kitasatospora sp. NPDC051914]|uniref:TIR-like protein FxsC n=1 Tax=Kitasatospora sp. NPDC051914 TaxID=3154945 RepID=UPI003432701D
MNSPGGWGKDAARPYFFLSYAHTPRATGKAGDPNHWVARLYDDLCEAITELTDVPEGVPVGFMDQSMHQGQFWAERLARELASCRVFVPLYSPRYFKSHACGQEWHIFSQRPVYQRWQDGEVTSGIVPVLWVAMDHYTLPRCASELQFNHGSFGPDYAAEGLYALMKLTAYRAQYELAVHRLAQRIVEVAERTIIPVARPAAFEDQPSAFAGTEPPGNTLRISVYSYRRGEQPPARSAAYYGARRTDWQPYRPESRRPLAEDAVDVARSMGFQASVHEFETEAPALLGGAEPTAPGIVLIDRWALYDGRRRESVRRLDQRNPAWITTLEPWNAEDEECTAHDEELTRLSDDVLRSARARRPTLRGGGSTAPGSLEAFRGEMEWAVIRANQGFERRDGPKTQHLPAPRRPSLRADFDTGQRPPRTVPLDRPGDDEDGGGTGRAAPGGGQP